MVKKQYIAKLALVAAILAFFVVGLGAYTRLTDSGLGCPDWPGCYGQLMVPSLDHELAQAQQSFPGQAVVAAKAWKEMIHRYVAGGLGLLIVSLSILLLLAARQRAKVTMIPFLLLSLLVFQAALGMWTVTWQLLPLVVMGHLLGGLLLLSCLWTLWLSYREQQPLLKDSALARIRPWAFWGLVLVFAQIALGGWTSSNYAALACPDFPMCNGQWLPPLSFHDAFNLFAPVGRNYEGGHLDTVGRVTIQFVHRLGAIVTTVYVASLAIALLLRRTSTGIRLLASSALVLLVIQVGLGIINAMRLPLTVAVGHNLVAALLLLVMITINYHLFVAAQQQEARYG